MKIDIPWWLTLVIILETAPMFIGPVVALNLPAMMGGPGAETINQAAYIYLARNFAVGLALLIAFALRNEPMLFILILVRLITDLIDLPTFLHFNLASNEPRLIAIFVFLYYVPAIFALRYIWQRIHIAEPVKEPGGGA